MLGQQRIALFIDGANLYATTKTLGFDIDYKRLLKEFQSRGYSRPRVLLHGAVEDQEYSSIRPLIDWLDYNGYRVVTKPTKEFVDSTGRRKVKGNMDIELAIDALELAPYIDHMVLFSGDGDFRSLVEAMQRRGVRVLRRLDDLDPAADGRRRAAPPGRRVHGSRPPDPEDRARPGRPARAPPRVVGDRRTASARSARPSAAAGLERRYGIRQAPPATARRRTTTPPRPEVLSRRRCRSISAADGSAPAPRATVLDRCHGNPSRPWNILHGMGWGAAAETA